MLSIASRTLGSRELALIACLTLPLSMACGDDGGGNTGDGLAPAVTVAFPPPASLTDADTITVRGRAGDPDGVAAIRVNGELATTSDGFAEWQAVVPLSRGDNAITITSEDSLGFIDESAASVTVTFSPNWLDVPSAVVADPANGRALALDRVLDAVLSIDYATGERDILSGEAVGAGPQLQEPVALAYDPAADTAWVTDGGLAALVAVDLATGDRTVISDAATGAGPALVQPYGLAADPAAGWAWVLDTDNTEPQNPIPVIVAIELATGDRTVLADPVTGDRPPLNNPYALVVDSQGARLLVADDDLADPTTPVPAIVAVDLATAALSLVSNEQVPALDNPRSMALDHDVAPGVLMVMDDGVDALIAVDLATGARTVVSQDGTSAGQDFSVAVGISLERVDADTTRALVIDTGIDELLAVDLANGSRTIISGALHGQGRSLAQPNALVMDAPDGSPGRTLLVDPGHDALLAIDPATGNRTVVSDDDTGAGDPFANPLAVALDVPFDLFGQAQAATRALVVDQGADAVISVDLASGARTELSGPNAGSGVPFESARGITFLPGDAEQGTVDRLLVADEGLGAIVAVDMATGERIALTDDNPANGPVLAAPQSVALEYDATGFTGRLLVVDRDPPALVAVNLADGSRTLVSGAGIGDGAPLENPSHVITGLQPAPPPDPEDPGTEPLPLYAPTGYVLIAHAGPGSLMAVNLANGQRTELYSPDTGRGPALGRPRALALDPDNERLTVADDSLRGVLMIDMRTSERVLVSR